MFWSSGTVHRSVLALAAVLTLAALQRFEEDGGLNAKLVRERPPTVVATAARVCGAGWPEANMRTEHRLSTSEMVRAVATGLRVASPAPLEADLLPLWIASGGDRVGYQEWSAEARALVATFLVSAGDFRRDLFDRAGALECYLISADISPQPAAFYGAASVVLEPTSAVMFTRRGLELEPPGDTDRRWFGMLQLAREERDSGNLDEAAILFATLAQSRRVTSSEALDVALRARRLVLIPPLLLLIDGDEKNGDARVRAFLSLGDIEAARSAARDLSDQPARRAWISLLSCLDRVTPDVIERLVVGLVSPESTCPQASVK